MDNETQEQKPLMDRIWEEMASISGPTYKAEIKTGQPHLEPPFFGRVSSVTFRRNHPFEQPAGPEATNDSLQSER